MASLFLTSSNQNSSKLEIITAAEIIVIVIAVAITVIIMVINADS